MSTLEILTSLKEINTRYSVFEADQVLTHTQLNSIADYLSDQTRLSRVQLLGVGISTGLRVSLSNHQIAVTPGIGITTDGDLFHLGQAKIFDRFKGYDESKPKYAPFYVDDDTMMPVYELVDVGATDDTATDLSQFNAEIGQPLSNFVAVLLMESYLKDDDLCSGTDCDNLGQDYIDNSKVLLIEKTAISALQTDIATPHSAFEQLEDIISDRPVITPQTSTIQQIANAYRAANTAMLTQLNAQFAQLWQGGATFLQGIFAGDPTPGWQQRLATINANFNSTTEITGIQYYYDFLKDVSETYNQFRELLFGELTWLCPDPESFPKHLLLGNVFLSGDPDENRTPFYPSPLISQTAEGLKHAQFLAQKIEALLQSFMTPAQMAADNLDIRVTPSRSEEFPLEDRAIPYYYADISSHPIQRHWNYRLHQRRQDRHNYSYEAANRYQAQGAAANPLRAQLGKFSFFRIEGHLGKPATTALENIEAAIAANNLPFTVQAVMVGSDKTKIIPKKRFKYTDLHRFHYLLRQDVSHQLTEVKNFSQQFKNLVDTSVNNETNAATLKATATQKNNIILEKNNAIQSKLNLPYTAYAADSNWQVDLGDATRTAGEFKSTLSDVVKTDFNTPFDSLISHTPVKWISWLDSILQQKEDQETDQQLFTPFIAQHPAIEHFGGVSRGGTFVLVYDSNNVVVADFMVPYLIQNPVEEPVEEPPLSNPPVKPGFILDAGIKVTPSLGNFVTGYFSTNIEPVWDQKLNFQQDYFNVFENSVKLMSETVQQEYLNIFKDSVSITSDVIGVKEPRVKDLAFADDLLQQQVAEIDSKRAKIDLYKQRAKQSDLPDDVRETYTNRARNAEFELAQLITETTDYVALSGAEVSTGSDGFKALLKVSDGINGLTERDAIASANEGLSAINDRTNNAGLKLALGNLLNR